MRTSARTIGICASALLSLVLLGPATAQQDMGNTVAVGATYTTGVVTARTPDSVTVMKDNGEAVTLLVEVATVGASTLQVDQRVRIDYHVNEYGQAVADVIQAGESQPSTTVAAIEPTVAPLPEPTPVAAAPVAAETNVAEFEPAPAIERELEAQTETLPATASRLPLLLLLGTTALLGAAALRLAR
ncbi:MAG: hypothetical protein NDJ75_06605 [Thermoanaerobaculia bacterium]|nr:hypothetical protein [Thermoanaerobaculia bacterium]